MTLNTVWFWQTKFYGKYFFLLNSPIFLANIFLWISYLFCALFYKNHWKFCRRLRQIYRSLLILFYYKIYIIYEKLTLNFQICFCGQIIALPHGASVSSCVSGLGLLDDQCESIFIIFKTKLWTFVTFLEKRWVNSKHLKNNRKWTFMVNMLTIINKICI